MEAISSPPPEVAKPHGIVARLTRGGASYAVATLVTRGVAFLLLPVYTRALTPADYGIVSLAETVAVSIPMLGGVGLTAALQRLYFKDASDPGRAVTIATILRGAFGWLLLVLTCALIAGNAIIHLVAPRFSAPFIPYVAVAFITAAANQVVEYRQVLFQNQERSRAYATLAVGSFTLTAACVLVLVVGLRFGAIGMLVGKLIGAVASAGLAFLLLMKHLRAEWNASRMREALSIGVPMVPHMFIALILTSAGVLIIQAYRSVEEVGLYSVSYALGASVSVVSSTLILTWSPVFYDLARHEERDRGPLAETSLLLTTVMVGATTIATVAVEFLIPLVLPERYHPCASLAPVVMGGFVFNWLFSLFQLALIQAGRSYLVALATVSAASMNLVLNFVLIPRWGPYGAAYATLVAYVVEALGMYIMAQRCFHVPYPLRRMLMAVGVYLLVMASTQAPLDAKIRRPLTLLLAFAAGALVYGMGRRARQRT